jgi:hypothetical protein
LNCSHEICSFSAIHHFVVVKFVCVVQFVSFSLLSETPFLESSSHLCFKTCSS